MNEPLHSGEPRRPRMLGNLVEPRALLRTAKTVREPAPGKRKMAMGIQLNMGAPKRALGKLLKHVRKAFNIESTNAKKRTHLLAEFNAEVVAFEDWRARNPAKSVKALYAKTKKTQIARGAAQSTFGAGLKSDRSFEISSVKILIGPGGREGTAASGDFARGGPRSGCAQAGDAVFGQVMQNVQPSKLAEFFENIMTIIGTSGQAIIVTKWSDSETVQYRVNGWAHNIATICDLVAPSGGKIEILKEGVQPLALEGDGHTKKGEVGR